MGDTWQSLVHSNYESQLITYSQFSGDCSPWFFALGLGFLFLPSSNLSFSIKYRLLTSECFLCLFFFCSLQFGERVFKGPFYFAQSLTLSVQVDILFLKVHGALYITS